MRTLSQIVLVSVISLFPAANVRAQNVVGSDAGTATVPAIQLPESAADSIIDRVPRLGPPPMGKEAGRIAARLERHVIEFLDGYPWLPFHNTLGISGYETCFGHSDRMFSALAVSLPFLSSATAARVRTFLKSEMETAPPFEVQGRAEIRGNPREAYAVPPELRSRARATEVSAFGVYAFWVWVHYAGETTAATTHWQAVQRGMKPLLESPYSFDPQRRDDTRDEAEKLNGDIAGLIAFVRLARLNGADDAEGQARRRVRDLLELRVNLDRVNPRILQPTRSASKSLHVVKLTRYCDLTPELGGALRQWTDGCAAARLKSFREERNGWFMAFGERLVGGENYTNPTHLPRAMMAGAAFIEEIPGSKLMGWVDVPWCKGDFYFMEKCAYALWAEAGRLWE